MRERVNMAELCVRIGRKVRCPGSGGSWRSSGGLQAGQGAVSRPMTGSGGDCGCLEVTGSHAGWPTPGQPSLVPTHSSHFSRTGPHSSTDSGWDGKWFPRLPGRVDRAHNRARYDRFKYILLSNSAGRLVVSEEISRNRRASKLAFRIQAHQFRLYLSNQKVNGARFHQ